MLPIADTIKNPVSRADALYLLWHAAFTLQPEEETIRTQLLAACAAMNSWKKPRLLLYIVLTLAPTNPVAAAAVLESMNEGRRKRQAERLLASGISYGPRAFFW